MKGNRAERMGKLLGLGTLGRGRGGHVRMRALVERIEERKHETLPRVEKSTGLVSGPERGTLGVAVGLGRMAAGGTTPGKKPKELESADAKRGGETP